MSKWITTLLVAGMLGILGGCASKPEPVQSNQQEEIARQAAMEAAAEAAATARRNAAAMAAAEAQRQQAMEALANAEEENRRMNRVFRNGLNK